MAILDRALSHLLFFCILLSALFGLSRDAYALSIQQIRFGVQAEKTRLVLEMDQGTDFRAFVLFDPYRMVIDLPDFSWRPGPIKAPGGSGVKAVRHGRLAAGVSRIVFDLDRPVRIQSAFVLPAQSGKPPRLVLDYAPTSHEVLLREKNTVHGTLPLSGGPERQTASKPRYAGDESPRTASLNVLAPPPSKPSAQRPQAKKPLIVIDPGHGGVDPGAIGANRIHEKDIVLKLSRELRDQLQATGRYRVLMTRDSDVFIKLRDRVKFARDHGADLFVSIHADSISKPDVSGASIYTLSENASDAQTAKLAAKENKADLIAGVDLSIEDEDVANILVDLAMRDTMNQSKFFANKLVKTFQANNLETLDPAHRFAGFAVLKAPDIPSILVEAGFMSNQNEANALNTTSHRKRIAKSLVSGINAYFDHIEKTQSY